MQRVASSFPLRTVLENPSKYVSFYILVNLNILRLSTPNLLQDIFPKKCKILIRFLEAFLSTVRGKQTMTDDMNREQNWTPLLNVIIQITIFKGAKKLEIISNVSVSK